MQLEDVQQYCENDEGIRCLSWGRCPRDDEAYEDQEKGKAGSRFFKGSRQGIKEEIHALKSERAVTGARRRRRAHHVVHEGDQIHEQHQQVYRM